MKKALLLGMVTFMSACAGMTRQVQQNGGGAERWDGFVLRDGVRVPVVVELSPAAAGWTGKLRFGDSSMTLQNVRVTPLEVHFELPGAGTFDGTVAGDSMAGSVSGANASGGFTLTREQTSRDPADVRESGDFTDAF